MHADAISCQGLAVLNKVDRTHAAINSLHSELTGGDSLEEALARIARHAVSAVVDADAVSITVLNNGHWRTAAYTEERILALDAEQYSSGRGPCLEAVQLHRPVRVAMDDHEQRWPEFVAAATADGVHATVSIPLIMPATIAAAKNELVGSVNAYSRRAPKFGSLDERLLCLFTDAAGHAVTAAQRSTQLGETISQLETALVSRAEIDQAKGALRVLHGCSADDAFAKLAQRSQHDNIKLRDLARDVLTELSRPVKPS